MTPLENLKAARELLSDPEKWTKNRYAADKDRRPVHPTDPSATCFCSYGALVRTAPIYEYERGPAAAILRAAVIDVGHGSESVADFNDHETTSHKDVLALFDRAIELAKEDE